MLALVGCVGVLRSETQRLEDARSCCSSCCARRDIALV